MRWSCLTLVLMTWVGAFATSANGSGPADDLFRLVPADSGVTLAVEDLRGHSREIRESPLFEGLRKLPVVQSWLASDRFRMIERTSNEVRTGLGISLETLRDDLFGDAVVFALQPGPATQPDLAQGLLLVRPRNRELIARLLRSLNEIQTRSGELDRVESRSRGTLTYMVRHFKAGQRPAEFTVQLDDGTFAWSNSEGMIQGVIDRKGGTGSGLGDDPRFRKVRKGLPDRAMVSLFVNPRLLDRLILDPTRSSKTTSDRLANQLVRYVGALGQVGFAVQWREGFVIHSHEVLEPEKLEPWLKEWLTRPTSPLPSQANSLALVPSTAVAIVSANLDFQAIAEMVDALTPNESKTSFANLKLAAQGVLFGHDPITWLLPRLDHTALVYLDVEPNPEARPSFPWVAVIGWQRRAGLDDLTGPIDNAIRTLFAMAAIETKDHSAALKVETKPLAEGRLTTLAKATRVLLSYRTDHDRLVIGNSAGAVARFATGPANPVLAELRAKFVSEAETFAIVDALRLVGDVKRLQEPIARRLAARSHRPVAATERDLAQVVDLAWLFRAFTFSTTTSKDATEIHRTIGLIGR
jgi:hypothetical protein